MPTYDQRRMIDEFHAEAERTGSTIMLAAGVDSIPSDLGTQLAIEQLKARGGRAAHVKALCGSAGRSSGLVFTHRVANFWAADWNHQRVRFEPFPVWQQKCVT